MTIKLDATRESVVVLCTDCPDWWGFAYDRQGGWTEGRKHELRAHPGAVQAKNALYNYTG